MECAANSSAPRTRLADANSVLASAICHLVLLLLMAFVTVATQENNHFALWLNTAGDSDGFSGEELGGGTFAMADEESPLTSDSLEMMAVSNDALGMTSSTTRLFGDVLGARAVGNSGGQGTGAGDGIGADFFGLGGSGSSFVYVIDCSGSMLDKSKFAQAHKELMKSIRGLRPEQKYFIVLYSDGAYPMDADEPIPATEENIAQTEEWLKSIRPDGGTNPLPALLFALTLKPSAIYFLSDGKFDVSVAQEMRAKNRSKRKRIPIHTISFYNRETEGLMKLIARNSGGKYKFAEK